MKAYLQRITTSLPSRIQSNEEIAAGIEGWSADRIAQKTGIRARRVAAEGETAGDLCAQAAEQLLAGVDRSQIDTLIVCTQSPDYFLPSTSCVLQSRLGLTDKCAAFDVTLGCSGYTYGLWLSRALLTSQSARKILFLAGDTYSKYCHPNELATASLFGDGATATLLSTDPNGALAEVGMSVLGTDGRGADYLIVKGGGSRHPRPAEERDRYLYMNGAEVASFAVSRIKVVIEDLLTQANLGWGDIDHFVFHQANPAFVQRLTAAYRLPAEKVPIGLAEVGNTCSATIPMVLDRAIAEQRFKAGDRLVLVGFGVGYSWAGTLLTWC